MRRALPFLVVFALSAPHPGNGESEPIHAWTAPPYWTPPSARELEDRAFGREPLETEALAVDALPSAAMPFVAITPCRLADTRGNGFTGSYGPPALTAGGAGRTMTITGVCGIPSGAMAVSFNVTVTNTQGPGFILAYPSGGTVPLVSTLNYVASQTLANAAVIPLSDTGGATFVAGVSGTDLILDVNGYYAPAGIVNSVNGLSGALTLAEGANVTITPSGSTLTIASSASAPVSSVFARTGAVIATAGDYAASQVTNTPSGAITSTTVQGAVNELDAEKAAASHGHAASAVTGLTSGGVLFGSGSGGLGQSATSFFWDETNGRLGLGIAAPSALLQLKSTGAVALQIDPYGASAGSTGAVRFMELAANGTGYVGLKAPDSVVLSMTYVLPSSSVNGVLRNASGVLSWDSSAGQVTSVFGRTGAVTATASDYTAAQVSSTPSGGLAATTVQAALNELDSEKSATSHVHAGADITSGTLPDGRLSGTYAGALNLSNALNTFNGASLALTGTLALGASSVVTKGGSSFIHTTGGTSTFMGLASGAVSSGFHASGFGMGALSAQTTAAYNTAVGYYALSSTQTAGDNSAIGAGALGANLASGNTAAGRLALGVNTTGTRNVAVGYYAARSNTTSSDVTAVGYEALSLSTGAGNTAVGSRALDANTTGAGNTAVGNGALGAVTSQGENTAVGAGALEANTAIRNTALGYGALGAATSGIANVAIGWQAAGGGNPSHATAIGYYALGISAVGATAVGAGALALNSSGADNTALGSFALNANTTGSWNTAVGDEALSNSGIADSNTAVGYRALPNSTSDWNTALGMSALFSLTTGSNNIAVGRRAGASCLTGSSNIFIGSEGADVSDTIRIGTAQTAAYMAGVYGQGASSAVAVVIGPTGKLGTVVSSRRYKRDIADLGAASAVLMQLRPVSFLYTEDRDPSAERQYGLIAEEVAAVAPELVVFGEDGQPETVKYHLVNAMLLDLVQRQQRRIERLEAARAEDDRAARSLELENGKLRERLERIEKVLDLAR